MTVGEVGTTIPLSWPEFRHKQEIAYRKEVIFFLQLCPGRRQHCVRAAFSICTLLKMSDVCNEPFGITHNLKTWQDVQSEAGVFGHCLFLSPLKRPFPAPATDKPFVFVPGWRSKHRVQTRGLWSVRVRGFIWHLHPTILITSASRSDKSDWQGCTALHTVYTLWPF